MTPTQGLVAEKYTLLGGTSRVLLTLKTNGDEHVLCAPHIAFQIFADTDMINLPSSGLLTSLQKDTQISIVTNLQCP